MYNEELDNSPIILILHNILNLHYVASSGLMMGVFHCFISGGTLPRRLGDTATNGREGGTVATAQWAGWPGVTTHWPVSPPPEPSTGLRSAQTTIPDTVFADTDTIFADKRPNFMSTYRVYMLL